MSIAYHVFKSGGKIGLPKSIDTTEMKHVQNVLDLCAESTATKIKEKMSCWTYVLRPKFETFVILSFAAVYVYMLRNSGYCARKAWQNCKLSCLLKWCSNTQYKNVWLKLLKGYLCSAVRSKSDEIESVFLKCCYNV